MGNLFSSALFPQQKISKIVINFKNFLTKQIAFLIY